MYSTEHRRHVLYTNHRREITTKLAMATSWAAIQRRGSKLAWVVILTVYGAGTIAIDLSLSALISWFMKSIIWF